MIGNLLGKSKALKSGIWYTIANFLAKSINFITLPIFARILTKGEFGLFNTYTSWQQILLIVFSFNVQSSLISAKYDYEDDFDSYVFSISILSIFSVLIWGVVINLFRPFWVEMTKLDFYYIMCILIYIMFYSIIAIFQLRERFLFKYKSNVLISVLISVLIPTVSLVLVSLMDNNLKARILGNVIPSVLIGGTIFVLLFRNKHKLKIKYWKYALKVCIPYIPHSLSLILLASCDKIMITNQCGSEDTAIYSMAYTCSLVIAVIISSLNEAFAPWLGDRLNGKEFERIKDVSKKYIFLFVYFAWGVMIVLPEILAVLGGKQYAETKYILAPIAFSSIIQFLYMIFVNIEQLKKKTTLMATATVIAAVINYVLNVIFIKKFGYMAAVYTTIIGYLCLLAMHMFIVKKINYSFVYSYKFIFAVALASMLYTAVIQMVYSYNWVRLVLLFVYVLGMGIVVYKYRKDRLVI